VTVERSSESAAVRAVLVVRGPPLRRVDADYGAERLRRTVGRLRLHGDLAAVLESGIEESRSGEAIDVREPSSRQ
jgi:hypothetical protein